MSTSSSAKWKNTVAEFQNEVSIENLLGKVMFDTITKLSCDCQKNNEKLNSGIKNWRVLCKTRLKICPIHWTPWKQSWLRLKSSKRWYKLQNIENIIRVLKIWSLSQCLQIIYELLPLPLVMFRNLKSVCLWLTESTEYQFSFYWTGKIFSCKCSSPYLIIP